MSHGVSMGFGLPPKTEHQPQAQTDSGVPSVFVLYILVRTDSTSRWVSMAVSGSREQLEEFVSKWIIRNPGRYGGQFKLEPLPFLLPIS